MKISPQQYKGILIGLILFIFNISAAHAASVTINYDDQPPYKVAYPELGFSLSSVRLGTEASGNKYHNSGLHIYRLNNSLFNIESVDLRQLGNIPSYWPIRIWAHDETGQIFSDNIHTPLDLNTDGSLIFQTVFLGLKNITSITFSCIACDFAVDNIKLSSSVSEVPLPASALLFAPALLGLVGFRRKAKQP